MIKNPGTSRSVNLFLTEVKSDPEIQRKFRIPSRGELSREENENRLKDHFAPLLDLLVQKFKDKFENESENIELIPKTKKEILDQFDIEYAEDEMLRRPCDFTDPITDEDVQAGVINSTILSTFCCREDKTDMSFHLHKIYSQYPDSILRQVMSQLRKSQMVSKKKQSTKKYLKDEVPITTIPFHLSVSFMHKFINKYQNDLFRNIDKFMKQLIGQVSHQLFTCYELPPDGVIKLFYCFLLSADVT